MFYRELLVYSGNKGVLLFFRVFGASFQRRHTGSSAMLEPRDNNNLEQNR